MSAGTPGGRRPDEPLLDESSGRERAGALHSNDAQMEELLGRILRIGVHASTVCLAVGLALSFSTGLASVSLWLMTAGLVMLMATPVARVATSVVDYALQRDWTFFILTAIVLLELCAGIVAALVFHRRT